MNDGDLKEGVAAEEAAAPEQTPDEIFAEFAGLSAPSPEVGEDEISEADEEPAEEAGSDEAEEQDESEDDAEDSAEVADEGTSEDDNAEDGKTETPEEKIARLEHELASSKGRESAQNRKIHSLLKQVSDGSKSSGAKDSDTSQDREAINEQLDQAREDYPDVIGPLADTIAVMNKRIDDLDARERQELDDKRNELNTLVDEQEQIFLSEHSDGFEVIQSNQKVYEEWIQDQKKWLRDIHDSNRDMITDGTGAALVLSRFKQALEDVNSDDPPPEEKTEKTILDKKRESQLDGARSTRSGGRQPKTGNIPPSSDDPEALFNHFAEDIQKRTLR